MTPETPLQTTAESVAKDKVKLRVEVAAAALEPAIAEVYRRWAKEIKVPGFRKGKVPRQLIDARVGPEAIRDEALRDALPSFYRDAMTAENLEAIAPPDVEVVTFEEGEPIVFEATVDVRPEITLPDLGSISVQAPAAAVEDADLDDQLERLRDRFAELESVGREVRRGDFVLIDLKGYRHDELIEGASAPDFLYEVGSGTGPPKLDAELEGEKPGAILRFTDDVHIHRQDEPAHDHSSHEEVSFTVLVKEVKTKKLPALDDEFAKTVGFDTLDELEADVRTRLADVKKAMAEDELRRLVLNAVVDATDLEPPERLVEDEFEHRLSHLQEDLRRAGLTLDDYGRQTQFTELEIRRDLRAQGAASVKAELILEEVARTAQIEVTQEEVGQEIAMAAVRAERDPQEVAKQIMDAGRLGAVAADVMRRKALDYVVERVDVQGRVADDDGEGPSGSDTEADAGGRYGDDAPG